MCTFAAPPSTVEGGRDAFIGVLLSLAAPHFLSGELNFSRMGDVEGIARSVSGDTSVEEDRVDDEEGFGEYPASFDWLSDMARLTLPFPAASTGSRLSQTGLPISRDAGSEAAEAAATSRRTEGIEMQVRWAWGE
jgi:hypothetical protein